MPFLFARLFGILQFGVAVDGFRWRRHRHRCCRQCAMCCFCFSIPWPYMFVPIPFDSWMDVIHYMARRGRVDFQYRKTGHYEWWHTTAPNTITGVHTQTHMNRREIEKKTTNRNEVRKRGKDRERETEWVIEKKKTAATKTNKVIIKNLSNSWKRTKHSICIKLENLYIVSPLNGWKHF